MLIRAVGAIALLLAATPTRAEGFREALTGGDLRIDLRFRFETVNDDDFARDAEASTLRLRLGYSTDRWNGLFGHVDFEAVRALGGELYDSTENGTVGRPVIADPEDTETNQAYMGYAPNERSLLKLGRQRIRLHDQRFVGNDGWRQNEQTFDGFSARSSWRGRADGFYAYLGNANRTFGEHHPERAEEDLNAHLLDLGVELPFGELHAYAIFLELEDRPLDSHRNLGLRFAGRRAVSNSLDLFFGAEVTEQSDHADGSAAIDAAYLRGELGIGYEQIRLSAALERLGGDGSYGFATPLASLHRRNGWADRFTETPVDGLVDRSVGVSVQAFGLRFRADYHDFSADRGSADYGGELDLLVSATIREAYVVGVKYARFNGDKGVFPDTEKTWLTLSAIF